MTITCLKLMCACIKNLISQPFNVLGDRKDAKTLERLRAERQAKIDELKERTNYYTTQQLIQVIIRSKFCCYIAFVICLYASLLNSLWYSLLAC